MLCSIDLLSYLSWSELNFNSGCVSGNQTTGTRHWKSPYVLLVSQTRVGLFFFDWSGLTGDLIPQKWIRAWLLTEVDLGGRLREPPVSLTLAIRLCLVSDYPSLSRGCLPLGRAEAAGWDLRKWSVYFLLTAERFCGSVLSHAVLHWVDMTLLTRWVCISWAVPSQSIWKVGLPLGTVEQHFHQWEENKEGDFKAHKLYFILYHQFIQQWQGNRC